MYKPYLSVEEYFDNGGLIEENAEKYLTSASRHIDSLTFNRIAAKGFENLTEYQQEIVKTVCFDMANFESENEDLINSVLQSYSVNGVSMQFGASWNVAVIGGVAIRKDTYNLLMQTGLCYRGI
ncbi:MAG: hypothetical protein K2M82_04660 [Lachnospiraceae bacterium]|nr:hypothetical protein [Lachnospiraceae bacterium]